MVNFRDSYFQVDWDLTTKRLKGTFWGKQYDTGRGFAVTVINGGQVVAPTTEVLRLKWEKPDKTTGYVNATIVNGKFIVENIDQMFTVHGSVRADFELSVGGEMVASITFYVNVEKAVAVDAIESSSEFTALQDALADVGDMQAQVDAVIANATVDSEVILARGTEATLGARLDGLTIVQPNRISQAEIGLNLIDKSNLIAGYYVSETNGSLLANGNYSVTDFVKIKPNTLYKMTHTLRVAFYDANKVFISGFNSSSFTSPANAAYIRVSVFITYKDIVMLCENELPTSYVPYSAKLPWLRVDKNQIESIPNITSYDLAGVTRLVNLYDKRSSLDGYYIENTDAGRLMVSAIYSVSDFIPAKENTNYTVTNKNRYYCYDKDKKGISGGNLSTVATLTTPPNTAYIRVTVLVSVKDSYMIVEGDSLPSTYSPFGIVVPWIVQDKDEIINLVGYKKSKYEGYSVVCFGDSITGSGDNTNLTNDKNYVRVITEDTGMITHKQGYHSARMAYYNDPIKGTFSMYKLVDAIIAGDFTEQENVLVGQVGYEIQYETLQRLKTIDFSTIDFLTIAFGRNDWGGDIALDNELNKFDTNTFKGSVRYVVKKMQEEFPQLKVLLLTPVYCFEVVGGLATGEDSKTWVNGIGLTLMHYVDALIEVGNELNTPVVDMTRDLGINEFNRIYYFASVYSGAYDGTHPDHYGTMLMGHKIAGQLLSRY